MNAPLAFTPRDAHSPLNRLERAGWAVIAAERFGLTSGEAAILRELAFAGGRYVEPDHLASHLSGGDRARHPASERLSVRVSRIRNALADMGLPRAAIESSRGIGYALAPHHARNVRQMVEVSA